MNKSTDLFSFNLDKRVIKSAALQAVAFILQNTYSGKDKDNKPFVGYGTKTFAMPLAAFFSITGKKHRANLNKEGDLQIFTSKKSGKRWIAIEGGYKNFKEKWSFKKAQTVNLSFSGQMLKELQVMEVGDSFAYIGFKSKEMAERASYHVFQGAGKRRVIRNFLGLPSIQQDKIAEYIAKNIKLEFRGLSN